MVIGRKREMDYKGELEQDGILIINILIDNVWIKNPQ
jgi:hypothetical protein